MTATSTASFQRMEAQVVDDTMEMGSPYHGHDDFEIDLDAMEDQASNADNDVMVSDAYPEASNENDADMQDDTAEPAMIDADEHFHNGEDASDGKYHQESFEAEMADEYDEYVDASYPTHQDDSHTNVDNQNDGRVVEQGDAAAERVEAIPEGQNNEEVERKNDQGVIDEQLRDHEEKVEEAPEAPSTETDPGKQPDETQAAVQEPSQSGGNDTEVDTAEVAQHNEQEENEDHDRANITGNVDTQINNVADIDSQEHIKGPEDEANETSRQEASVGEPHTEEAEGAERSEAAWVHGSPDEEEQSIHEAVSLHPVKVLYQDNEISLFPPKEGDFSETFFLEDESVARENLGSLFAAFRNVLGEHLGEHEILAVDVDNLNIRLLEVCDFFSSSCLIRNVC